MTLKEILRENFESTSTAIASTTPLTWFDLGREARDLAKHLRPSDLVTIHGPVAGANCIILVAAILADATFVLAGQDLSSPLSNRLFTTLRPTVSGLVRGDRAYLVREDDGPWALERELPPLRYIGITSGSTRAARLVMNPRLGSDYFLAVASRVLLLTNESVFADPANSSDLSLTNFLLTLWSGGTWAPLLLLSQRIRLPTALGDIDATHWRSVPAWTEALVTASTAQLSVGSIEVFGFGGDIVRYKDVARAARLYPTCRFINTYGATETNGFASFEWLKPGAQETGECPIGSGIEGWRLEGAERQSGEVELVVRSEHLAHGVVDLEPKDHQLEGAEQLSQRYRELQGRFFTRDRAEYRDDGGWRVLGRLDRRFNHRGILVSPEAIEGQVYSVCGRSSCLLPHEGILVLLIEGESSLETEEAIGSILPISLAPLRTVFVHAIPRSRAGKVDYRSVESLVRSHLTVLGKENSRRNDELERA